MMAAWTYAKLAFCFVALSALSVVLSPIIVPVVIPLLVILVGCLMTDAQGTVGFLLKAYHGWNLLKIKYYYKSTPKDRAHARLVSGQAWSEFCDTLKEVGSCALRTLPHPTGHIVICVGIFRLKVRSAMDPKTLSLRRKATDFWLEWLSQCVLSLDFHVCL